MNADRRHASLRDSAAAWHNRLQQDGGTLHARRAFLSWLAESDEHRIAYDEMERSWRTLRSQAEDPRILALRHETALRLTRGHSRDHGRLVWLGAAAAVLALTVLIFATRAPRGTPASASQLNLPSSRVYSTGIGQQLPVSLPDGSRITLDTQSQLRVTFSARERNVQLVHGQALFEVAKDKYRPFAVTAGDRRFVALGTVFDVHVSEQQIKLTMVEGSVRVEYDGSSIATQAKTSAASGSPPPAALTLTAGEQLEIDGLEHDLVYNVDPKLVTSWLHGQIIFDDTSLAVAATELNRYSTVQIRLGDPRLAAIRLSGTFTAGRPDLFVEAVTTYYPITVVNASEHTLVLEPR